MLNIQIHTVSKMDEDSITLPTVHHIVQVMANFINYLNVSLYENMLNYKHERARAELDFIYENVAMNPSLPPSLENCALFYNNIDCLTKVTYTDDVDYYTYKRTLKKYIVMNGYTIVGK